MAEVLKKNAKGHNYNYTDLAEVTKYIESIGEEYYQYVEPLVAGDAVIDYVYTVRIKDGKEMSPIRGCRVAQATLRGVNNPAQEQGSALTYARRYSLYMAYGLSTSDDDAQCLSTPKSEAKEPTKEELKEQVLSMLEVKGISLAKFESAGGMAIDDMPIAKLKEGMEFIRKAK